MIELCTNKLFVASLASELLQPCKHLPKDFSPGNLLLPQEKYKLIDIPMLVTLMLRDNVTVEINKQVCLWALHPLLLIICIKSATVGASME